MLDIQKEKTSKIFRSWRLAEAEMNLLLVPEAGLEPAWHAPYAPETYASTNFATRALWTKTCEGKSTHRISVSAMQTWVFVPCLRVQRQCVFMDCANYLIVFFDISKNMVIFAA